MLLFAYLIALVYGSLYPWSGWRWLGFAAFDFLFDRWPRYWTWLDVQTNVAVYLPVGLLGVTALRRGIGPIRAALVAAFAGCLVSLALESAQSMMPGRVPSRLDWLANSAGAVLGALAGLVAVRLSRWRVGRIRPAWPASQSAVGLALVAAWLAIQLHPQRLLFGNGDVVEALLVVWTTSIEPMFGDGQAAAALAALRARALADALRLDADYTVLVEASGTASAIVAIGMLIREIYPPGAPRMLIAAATVAIAALARSASATLLFGASQSFAWLTAGAQGGLVVGAVALSMLSTARRRTRLRICVAALVLTAVLTNVFPPDAYYESAIGRWDRGPWRNFTGLLEAAALAWPFVAIGWCLVRLAAMRANRRSIIDER